MARQYGKTEPRLFTPPLCELTPETSLGFEVADFASEVLGVDLFPWQRWLLVHALELNEDGSYRFRKIITLVGRQNGKTLLAAILAAWWLFVDSTRYPERVPPFKFKVVGIAQNLDIASGPWKQVKLWCDPEPDTEEAAVQAVPMLQEACAKVSDTNGKEAILAESLAHYEIKAGKSARGKPAARALMDELREEEKWDSWNALGQTTKSFWSGQLFGFSNAGTAKSVVLAKQREVGLGLIEAWNEAGGKIDKLPASFDETFGFFEWSAPDECATDDPEAILQANPSIGYGGMTVATCLSDRAGMLEAAFRTEVLCQWVTAKVEGYIPLEMYEECVVPASDVNISRGARTVWGVDVSQDRSMTYVAAATMTEDGLPFVSVRAQRAGMLWLVEYLSELAERSGFWEVALQSKGCPAMEFAQPLSEAGFTVYGVDGSQIGIATGRFRDRIRDRAIVLTDQPTVRLGIEGGVTAKYAENDAWSRNRSQTDVAPVVAETVALFGLETRDPGAEVAARSAYESHGLLII